MPFCFVCSGTFRIGLGIERPTPGGGGLNCMQPQSGGGVATSVRLRTKVRLDDDLQRGAFGLTTDKKPKAAAKGKAGSTRSPRGADPHVANALRSAYEEAVKEDVPSEFLDLLGKLN